MRYYDFLDKAPKIDGLVIIEGTDSVLAQWALDTLLDRLIPADMRALNLEVIDGPATDELARTVADSVAAMPFLAERRVVAVRGCERIRRSAASSLPRSWDYFRSAAGRRRCSRARSRWRAATCCAKR